MAKKKRKIPIHFELAKLDDKRLVDAVGTELVKDVAHALALSTKKWEFIVEQLEKGENIIEDGGQNSCALCWMFRPDPFARTCGKCPIKQAGHPNCRDTPAIDFDKNRFKAKRTRLKYARAEVKFLQKLGKELK